MNFNDKLQFPRLQSVPPFYQDVILGYCKSNIPAKVESKSDLYNQILWGNRNLLVNKTSLFSQPFIEAGYNYVRDVLDENGKMKNDIYDNLTCKQHYFRTMSLIQYALRPYKHVRYVNDVIERHENNINLEGKKSKWFYVHLLKQKSECPKIFNKWSNIFNQDIEWKHVYERKIKNQFEAKITEFNFKLLHQILPTGRNLQRWKKLQQQSCIYCQCDIHDAKHLLYECPFIGNIWHTLGNIVSFVISWETIAIGARDIGQNNRVVSLLSYVIYKKYLIDREKGVSNVTLSHFIKKDITYRLDDYSLNVCPLQCRVTLRNLIECLT